MQGSGLTALVVDDDAALRLLMRVNLELEGFEVAECATVEEAETAVRAARPHVVLLDVHLGSRDTRPLLAWLRSQDIPVALVTGSVDLDEYRSSADGILGKPFTPQALVALARRLARVEK
jgi:DNA-binding response OmpR family regulator